MTSLLQILPTCFVNLGSNDVIEVLKLVIFAHWSRRETQLAMRRCHGQKALEHSRWYDVHFIEKQQAPDLAFDLVDDLQSTFG